MKKTILFVLLVQFLIPWFAPAADTENAASHMIRIGVDNRMGFQSCIDSWQPVAEYLSKEIPGYRFMIVPLASQQDLARTLENGDVEFTVLNPALEIVAEDRYGTVPLASMVESDQDGIKHQSSSKAGYGGAIIRRADRSDIENIQNIRGQRLSAVKPWSFTGWIAQWGFLAKNDIDPLNDLKQVVFEGTHGQVVKRVLDGSADAGAVDADLLSHMAQNGNIPDKSLYVINHRGKAVPLVVGEDPTATDVYPGWVFSKTEAVSDELAQDVAAALIKKSLDTSVDGMPYRVGWVVPRNYGNVRRLLQKLMGPEFAESIGFPLPKGDPTWLFPARVLGCMFAVFAVAFMFWHNRYLQREVSLKERLEATRKELIEVRVQKQRIDAILALAGCGIDIVDDDNQIIYADSSLERKYGDWHEQKCHGYYCGSDTPCPGCRRPSPMDEQRLMITDLDGSQCTNADDPHAHVHYIEGETTRMIGIPFRDEGGRWLYARIHFPLMAFSA